MPIRLLIKDKVYRDLFDITAAQAYQALSEDPDHFGTSPSSPGDFLESYRSASLKAKNVLCITISSGLSAGYSSALLAADLAKTELPGTPIHVLDSRNVTAAEGFIVLAAAKAAAAGKTLQECTHEAEIVRDKVTFLAYLDTLKYVYRTGRVPKIVSKIGSALHIKAVLTVSDGLVHMKHIVTDKNHAVNLMLRDMKDFIGDSISHIAVMHADVPEEAEQLKEMVAANFKCSELWITEFSPVMGYATGRGTLGLAFYAD